MFSGGSRIFPRRVRQLSNWDYYRPQRSWAKVIFSQVCVCPQGGGVSASVHAGIPDPRADTSPEQTPWEQTPPGSRHPPEAYCSMRLTSGRYASYWNAFLFCKFFCRKLHENERIWIPKVGTYLSPPLRSANDVTCIRLKCW